MRGEVTARNARAAPGVIDSLSEGFARINQILWILLLPIGLDVLLRLAPRVSAAPLARRWIELSTGLLTQYETAGSAPFDPQTLEAVRQMAESAPVTDLLSLVTWNLANAAVPTLGAAPQLVSSRVVEVDGLLVFLGLLVALQALGLLLGCVYYGLIGQQVRDGKVDPARLVRRVGRYWLSALGFIALVMTVIFGVSVPLSVVVGVLTLFAPGLAAVLYAALMMTAVFAGLWMLLYLFFLVDAIVLGELGPLGAIRSSALVVRRHFGSSLGLIGLVLLINLGMQVVWSALAQQPWGLGVAIAGNAYVASGLAAASMLFYRNRATPG